MTKEEPNPLTLGSTFLAPVLGCTATMLIVLWAAAGLDDWLWSAAMFLSLGISGNRRHLNILRSTLIVGISVAHIAVAGYFVLPGDMLLPVATFLAGQSEDNIDR